MSSPSSRRIRPRRSASQQPRPVARDDRELTLEELEEGRRVAALVVKHCGELYMPIFEKFDKAIIARQNADDRLSLVLNSQAPVQRVPRRKPQRAHRKKDGRSS